MYFAWWAGSSCLLLVTGAGSGAVGAPCAAAVVLAKGAIGDLCVCVVFRWICWIGFRLGFFRGRKEGRKEGRREGWQTGRAYD